jgi:phosphatidylinositol-3-phosphatase
MTGDFFVAFKKLKLAAGLLATALAGSAMAAEGPVPNGVSHLDHVFLIMMENHGYGQIMNNPNAPFINELASKANLAINFFAVGHPSLTNYLEVVGGSNFGVLSDNNPDWHSTSCKTNLSSGIPATDTPSTGAICPIAGTGTDAPTVAVDTTNEDPGHALNNINGSMSFLAANTVGKTIGDQLVAKGKSWKSYQESLPLGGADNVNYSDGVFTDKTDFSQLVPAFNPASGVVSLYASKHNPFVYFKSVQDGTDPRNSLNNSVGFDGPEGLYADLATGKVPSLLFIAPNQCNDQHGRGNAGPFCNYDPNDNGSQAGLNPALIYQGDLTVKRLVQSIKASPAWREGQNAIIVMWDENDYSIAPNTNQVIAIVDSNNHDEDDHHHDQNNGRVQSSTFYTHFSMLKSLESAFGLPCLNHACDDTAPVMADMFRR